MKFFYCLLIIAFLFPTSSYSQFDILKKAKEKIEEEINKSDQGEEEEKEIPENETANENEEDNTAEQPKGKPELKSYSKFDFIPGNEIIFYDDFSQEAIGDFPLKWNTNGSGEVVTLNNFEGKWFKVLNAVSYIPYLETDSFGEDFTTEIDFLINPANSQNGTLYFDFYSTKEADNVPSASSGPGAPGLLLEFSPNDPLSDFSATSFYEKDGYTQHSSPNQTQSKGFIKGEVNRLSFSFNKTRFRAYLNDKKVIDLPRILKPNTNINQLCIRTWYWNDNDEQPVLIKNIRIAQGLPDSRNELITKGKLVTHGINFASGSDKIQPESYGTLKDIASVLNDNPDLKVQIIGHTDSDGDENQNIDLSKRRAEAVKNALVSEFSIDAARLETDGKGESQPVSGNDSTEGKANNRRVEFVKL